MSARKKIAIFQIIPMPYKEALIAHLRKWFEIKEYFIEARGHIVHSVSEVRKASENTFYMFDGEKGFSPGRGIFRAFAALNDLVRWDPDVVLFYGFYSHFWPSMIWTLLSEKKICLQGDSSSRYPKHGWLKRLRNRIAFPAIGRIFDLFMATGKGGRQWLEQNGVLPGKIITGTLSASWSFWSEYLKDSDEAGKFESGDINILSVCRLVPEKGLLDGIKALKLLQEKGIKGITYTIVGGGPERGIIEKEAERQGIKVEMPGVVPPEELARYYRGADLFLFPSHRDRWGVVVHEAALFGLPLLLSNHVGSVDDFLEEGVNGFMFTSGVPDEIADAIEKSLPGEFRRKAARRSRELAERIKEEESAMGLAKAICGLYRFHRRELRSRGNGYLSD